MKVKQIIVGLLMLGSAEASLSGASSSQQASKHHRHGHNHVHRERYADAAAVLTQAELNEAQSTLQYYADEQAAAAKVKDRKSFVTARNKLNEEEHALAGMFDTLSEKLTDSAYIGTAINSETKNKQWRPNQLVQMAEDNTTRVAQNKTRAISPIEPAGNLTNNTANGTYTVADNYEVVKCAAEGAQCSCLGRVHFGKAMAAGAPITTLSGMRAFNVSTKDVRDVNPQGGAIGCSVEEFGVDPLPGEAKQCLCEREAPPTAAELPKDVKKCGRE